MSLTRSQDDSQLTNRYLPSELRFFETLTAGAHRERVTIHKSALVNPRPRPGRHYKRDNGRKLHRLTRTEQTTASGSTSLHGNLPVFLFGDRLSLTVQEFSAVSYCRDHYV